MEIIKIKKGKWAVMQNNVELATFRTKKEADNFKPKPIENSTEHKANSRGRKPRYSSTQKIKKLVKGNPCREGTIGHRLFALYKDQMTIANFVKAGGDAANVSYNVKMGRLSIQ